MPHVLAAWVRWAGRRRRPSGRRSPNRSRRCSNSMGAFAQRTGTGRVRLDYALVRRLLPDGRPGGAAQASVRVPGLEAWHSGSDLSILDPADPNDRPRAARRRPTPPRPRRGGPAHRAAHGSGGDVGSSRRGYAERAASRAGRASARVSRDRGLNVRPARWRAAPRCRSSATQRPKQPRVPRASDGQLREPSRIAARLMTTRSGHPHVPLDVPAHPAGGGGGVGRRRAARAGRSGPPGPGWTGHCRSAALRTGTANARLARSGRRPQQPPDQRVIQAELGRVPVTPGRRRPSR